MSDAGTRKHAMHNMSSADYWMACDIWYSRKLRAIEQGKEFGGDSAASIRGTRLHELFEAGLRDFLATEGAWSPKQFARQALVDIQGDAEQEQDAEQLARALLAAGQVLELLVEPTVMLEVAVPLAHEPESQGYIDFIAFDDDKLFIVDAKFGRIKVEPDCPQLYGYGGNVLRRLRAKGIPIPRKIFLGVIQPRHYAEALIHETTEAELDAFVGRVIETVERQKKPGQKAGPKDLTPCTWCDFSTGCPARAELLAGMEAKLQTAIGVQQSRPAPANDEEATPEQEDIPLPTELVEWVMRNKGAIEDVLEECRELVLNDEQRFPNWRRTRTSNGQTWDLKTLDEEEVAGQLDELGIEKFWRLRTPADLIAEFPDLKAKIRGLTMESGFHFRLKALDAPPAEAASEGEDGAAAAPPKKRPPSRRIAQAVETAMESATPWEPPSLEGKPEPPTDPPKRKRGRPSNKERALMLAQQEIVEGAKASSVVKKKTKTRKKKGE